MTGERLFRLVRTVAMAGAVASAVAVLQDPDGIPDAKWLCLWASSGVTLFMVWKGHKNRLEDQ